MNELTMSSATDPGAYWRGQTCNAIMNIRAELTGLDLSKSALLNEVRKGEIFAKVARRNCRYLTSKLL